MARTDEDTQIIPSSSLVTTKSLERERTELVALRGPDAGSRWTLQLPAVLGRGSDADVRLAGDGISRLHVRIERTSDGYSLHDLDSRNGTLLNGDPAGTEKLRDGDKIQVGPGVLLVFCVHDAIDAQHQERLHDSAYRDVLTGVHNRRYLEERFHAELAFAVRHTKPLAMILADIDRFKSVNDTHGHAAGDAVLVAVGACLRRIVRTEDVVARYGGEELVILSRDTDRAGAYRLAERARAAVEVLGVPHGDQTLAVTISAGVAVGPSERARSFEAYFTRADRALYDAKRAGRNRVVVAE